MSMYPQALAAIPEETVRVARAACPKGTLAMRLGDELAELYQDEQFSGLYPERGQPAYAPWQLALVTVLQYTENVTDRQAANAVRERIDWKYCLRLPLTDPGFHSSILSEFRARLGGEGAQNLLLDRLLQVCEQRGWLRAGGKQRTDSTHVLARVRSLSNLECVGETLRATLNELAEVAPSWLVSHVTADWFDRYAHRIENYRLPKAESQRTSLAQQIGADGLHVQQALDHPDAPPQLKEMACVEVLKQVWAQYYDLSSGKAKWRAGPQEQTEEGVLRSPYDPEARIGKKREIHWLGYKVHLTETCEEQGEEAGSPPQLIVAVQTSVGNVQDVEMTATILEDVSQKHLLPEEQIVDTGYVDADLLVSTQQTYGVKLLGPVLGNNSWQKQGDQGFDASHFHLDWEHQQAICPQGQQSHRWGKAGERIEVVFARETCAGCPVRDACTKSLTTGRVLHLRPQAAHEALQERRREQQTEAFRKEYTKRAGIEATHSQGIRKMGLRRSRYDGLEKTHVQHVVTAVAINLVRIDALLTKTSRGTTHHSHFARLSTHPTFQETKSA